jgi:hypothetical protein
MTTKTKHNKESKMSEVQRLLKEQYGFITNQDELLAVIAENPNQKCIVRCGNGRFLCDAKDVYVKTKPEAVAPDYVRDVSIYPFHM